MAASGAMTPGAAGAIARPGSNRGREDRSQVMPAPKKRSGRRAGPTNSRQLILDASRSLFSAGGFEGTTMRAIAHASGVDAALIHHFFVSKEALFTLAMRDAFSVIDLVPSVVDGSPERTGERLARAFISYWERPEVQPGLVGLLRSATTFEGAATAIRDFLGAEVLQPVTTTLGYGQSQLRASLVGSQLLGLAMMRYLIRGEPIAALRPEQVVFCVADVCQHYLVERL
jgi:AcrR family transcriptional regulator